MPETRNSHSGCSYVSLSPASKRGETRARTMRHVHSRHRRREIVPMSLTPLPHTEGYAGYLAFMDEPRWPLTLELLKSLDDLDEEEDEDDEDEEDDDDLEDLEDEDEDDLDEDYDEDEDEDEDEEEDDDEDGGVKP